MIFKSRTTSRFRSTAKIALVLTVIWLLAGCKGGAGSNGGAVGSGGGSASGTVIPSASGPQTPGANPPPSGGTTDVVPGGGFDDGSGSGGSGGGGSGSDSTSASLTVTVPSGGSGTARSLESVQTSLSGQFLALNVAISNANAFQIVSQNGSNAIASVFLLDPSGNQVLSPADFRKTSGLCTLKTEDACLDLGVNVIPYRAAPDDSPVVDGTYQQTLFSNASPVTSTVIAKNDTDFTTGVLRVNIFLVGNDAQDEDFKNNVLPQAIAIWKSIYSSVNITVQEQIFNVSSNFGVLPNPLIPSSLYASAGQQGGVQPFALNVFIGTSISNDGTENPGNEAEAVFGIAAQLPGAGIITGRSAVAVSLTTHQGSSGTFDSNDKIQIFGETMAHEGGHYLGLFHPVENSDSGTFETFDILSDTAECTNIIDCITSGVGTNLMFPFPIDDENGPHIAQTDVSVLQGRVINLQAIVD